MKKIRCLVVQRTVRRYTIPNPLPGSKAAPKYLIFEECDKGIDKRLDETGVIWRQAGLREITLAALTEDYGFVVIGIALKGSYLAANLIARLRGKKVAYETELWEWSQTRHSPLGRIRDWLTVKLMLFGDFFLAKGPKQKEFLEKHGVSPRKIITYFSMNSLSLGKKYRGSAEEARKRLGLKGGKTILFIGRLVERKNPMLLLKAFTALSRKIGGVTLIVVGDGPYRGQAMSFCEKHGLKNVVFAKPVNQSSDELMDYYAACDVLALPSSREPYGAVIDEAVSFGKPVISTDDAGATYMVVRQGVNGYIVRHGSMASLYAALEEFVSGKGNAETLAMGSKKVRQDVCERNFSFEEGLDEIAERVDLGADY